MPACSDLECVVCYHEYNPDGHMPRVLECQHTFCTPCLQRLSQRRWEHLTICCPLCRRVTCVSACLTLTCSLLIDIEVWSQITKARRHGRKGSEDRPEHVFTEWKGLESRSANNRRERCRRQLQRLQAFLKGY